MEISDFTIRIIILLIPGIIATVILENLTIHKRYTPFHYGLYSLLLGFCSYLVLKVVYFFFGTSLVFWEALLNEEIAINPKEILLACVCSVFVGLAISAMVYWKVLIRIAKLIRITDKFGDENLYSFFLNSPDVGYVYVRDLKNEIVYLGYVESFSETDHLMEILLRDVSVYMYGEEEPLYETSKIYLNFKLGEMIIDYPG